MADDDLVEGTEEAGAGGVLNVKALPVTGTEERIAVLNVRQQDPGSGTIAAGNIAIRVLLVHPALRLSEERLALSV